MTTAVEQGWAWMPLVPLWLLLVAGVVSAALVAAAVRNTPGRPGRAALSAVLRAASLAALLLVLAGPSRTTEESRSIRHRVILLLDDSASMSVRDGADTRAARAAAYVSRQAAAAEELGEDVELQLRSLRDPEAALDPAALAAAPMADGLYTDYLTALETLADEIPPAAIVLVADGADRATLGRLHAIDGLDGLRPAVRDLPFPVHTVTVGGPIEQDLQVQLGPTPPFAFVRRPFDLPVDVRSEDLGGEVPVSLRIDGVVHATRTVSLPDGGGVARAEFHVTPEATGTLTLEVAGPVPAGDPLPHNNGDACTLRVIRDRTRVLQLAGSPSWDVRFLRRFLKGDPNIDLVSFFIMRTGPTHGRYRGSPLSLIEFPHEELFSDDLPGFDLVVLQNFTFDGFPSRAGSANDRYTANLAAFVEDGGALLILGGDRSFADGGLSRSPLRRVLPFEVPDQAGSVDAAAAPVLTEVGLRHPVTDLAGSSDATGATWADMPAVQGHNRVGEPMDGAAVLVTAGEGGDPLIAVREVGRGRVLAVTTDDTWRWGREAGSGGLQYRAFWRGALRWLLREEARRRLELRVDRETVPVGSPARLTVQALGEDYGPQPGAEMTLEVQPLAGGGEVVERAGLTGEDGSWTETLDALPPGSYRAIARRRGEPPAGGPDEAEVRFTVRAEREELLDPAARPGLLADLARATGGRDLAEGADLGPLLRGLGPGTQVTRLTATPAWDRGWWLLAVALPLVLDWMLRRRWGSP